MKVCRKHCYGSELDARIAMANMPDNPRRQECRAYFCRECWAWHLTSQEVRGLREERAS